MQEHVKLEILLYILSWMWGMAWNIMYSDSKFIYVKLLLTDWKD